MKKNIGIFLVMCIMLTACKNDKFPYDDELDDSEKNEAIAGSCAACSGRGGAPDDCALPQDAGRLAVWQPIHCRSSALCLLRNRLCDAAKQGIRRLVQGALLHRRRGQCRRNDIGLWTLDLIDIQNSGADDETGAAV